MPSDLKKNRNVPDASSLKDSRFLDKVIEILSTPVKKYKNESTNPSVPKNNLRSPKFQVTFDREAKILKQFWIKYKNERSFSQLHDVEKFLKIFQDLVRSRLCNSYWNEHAMPENVLRLFQCLRILLRDQHFQVELHNYNGLPAIAKNLKMFAEYHMSFGGDEYISDILKEITNICQKLSAEAHQRNSVTANGIHKSLLRLLSSNDVLILHLSLYALIGLTKSEEPKAVISELNYAETLVQIVSEYDVTSKQLAVTLLRQLCTQSHVREQVKVFHAIPVLLSLLRNDTLKLLWNVVWILVQLAEDHDTSNEIRLLGGIPLLIALLQDRQYIAEDKQSDGSSTTNSTVGEVPIEQKLSLKAAVCAALTELVLNDTNARFVVQANGIFLVSMLIFPSKINNNSAVKSAEQQLQKNAFRTLRFLFSMEKNRQLFKRLFSAKLFEMFIDVGHYQKDLESYDCLVNQINSLDQDDLLKMKQRVLTTNQNKAPSSYIQQYAVYEHLGSGAFGSVYKVKRKGGQTFLAMKEISTHHPEFGKGLKERNDSIHGLFNECSFVKKQLNHTNIVKYHKAFLEGDKLFIIMDLIDGAPLGEHFHSLKEKGEMFTEDRLWDIFIQMVLALHYIHKEKNIVHRDLTPNNIMLGENDKVTITDFGLAKSKNPDASKLTSMVGTILYSCPEVVRGLPYGDKADIWAIGCILYQMATLEPPFFSSNMLSLATKIVEAEFKPLQEDLYSPKVSIVIQRCLTVKAEQRPDILELAALIPEILIQHMENLRLVNANIEKKLDKERKRVQKHSDLFKNYQQNYRNLDESFSEDSTNKTQDSMFDDKENSQTDIHSNEALVDNTYENNLTKNNETELDNNTNEFITVKHHIPVNKSAASSSIQIMNLKNKLEQTSSSGSWDSNDDEVFKKPKVPPPSKRRLLPLESTRKNGRNASETELDKREQSPVRDNIKRTQSCSYLDNINEKTPTKLRPISAQATLTISPRKVREINDPVLQMLSQLHKIIFISQLPPSLKFDPNRRVIDQFKRSLFTTPSSAVNLKNELKKLMEGSKEQVDVHLGYINSNSRLSASMSNMSEHEGFGVTYEDMQIVLENSLLEAGYYNIPPTRRMKPLGPITSSNDPAVT